MFSKSQACRPLPAAGGKDLDGSNFLFRKTVWQVFSPNHRFFKKEILCNFAHIKVKIAYIWTAMLSRAYYRHHSASVQCPLTTSSQHQPKREALIGKPERGRDLALADGCSYRGCPRVTTLTGMLTVFELAWMEPPARSGHVCRTLHRGQTL